MRPEPTAKVPICTMHEPRVTGLVQRNPLRSYVLARPTCSNTLPQRCISPHSGGFDKQKFAVAAARRDPARCRRGGATLKGCHDGIFGGRRLETSPDFSHQRPLDAATSYSAYCYAWVRGITIGPVAGVKNLTKFTRMLSPTHRLRLAPVEGMTGRNWRANS